MAVARVVLCSLLLLAVFVVEYHTQPQTKPTCSGRFFRSTRCLRKKFLTRRIAFYPNTTATFNPSLDLLICCGDVHPMPGPRASSVRQRTSNLSVMLINARSLRNKLTDFQDSIYSNDVDILVITEIWLTPAILDHEVFPSGYSVYRCDREEDRRGGGVLIAIKDIIKNLIIV